MLNPMLDQCLVLQLSCKLFIRMFLQDCCFFLAKHQSFSFSATTNMLPDHAVHLFSSRQNLVPQRPSKISVSRPCMLIHYLNQYLNLFVQPLASAQIIILNTTKDYRSRLCQTWLVIKFNGYIQRFDSVDKRDIHVNKGNDAR